MKATEAKAPPVLEEKEPCLVCGKLTSAPYGTWGVTPLTQGVTCSRKCDNEQAKRSSFFFYGD